MSNSALRALTLFGLLLASDCSRADALPPPPTYRIAGVVVDSFTGQPLDGAEVTLAPVAALNDVQTFLTSGDGRFVFAGLAPGKYSLAASRRGYARQGLDQHESYWTGVVVGLNIDSEHIRFRLAASAVLTGVVTDEWGDPVRHGTVMLFHHSMFDGSRTLRNINQTGTDDEGRYRFAHLLAGTYVVAVHTTPWFTQPQFQAELRAAVRSAMENRLAQTAAVDEGPIVVDQLTTPPGVPLDPTFDVVYPVIYYPNATRLADATRLSLVPVATQIADFQLRTVPSIHIRVRSSVECSNTVSTQEDGTDSVGAVCDSSTNVDLSLRIGDTSVDQLQPTRTEIAPGLFELSGIPPGEFTFSATSFPNSDGSYVSRTQLLSLSGDTDVDINPHGALANVSGVVLINQPPSGGIAPAQPQPGQSDTDADDAPGGFSLTLHSLNSNDSYDAVITRKGEFNFEGSVLPPGSYEVELVNQAGMRVSFVEANGAVVSGRTIEIPADHPVKLVVHTAEAKTTLSGFALKNGKPVSGAMVLLVPRDPGRGTSIYHRDQSDSDGSFLMSPLFPGKYTLLAIENGWDLEWSDPAILFRYLPGGQPVEISADGTVTCNAKVQ